MTLIARKAERAGG